MRYPTFVFATIAALTSSAAMANQDLYEKAYIYGLPIIMSYKTMYLYSVDDSTDQFKAPFNQIKNTARVYGPKDTAVVSANSDTPYSTIWLDLRAEPMVLCVPKIEKDRYFSVMVQDLSTNLMDYIGSRTTGNDGGCYAVAGPDWSGDTPDSVDFVETSATDFVFVAYRTQLKSADDLDNVKKVQAGYSVQTLSAFEKSNAPEAAETIDFLKWDEEAATGNDFIKFLNFNLQFIQPSDADSKILQELEAIGVGAGKDFDFAGLDADTQAAVKAGVTSAISNIDYAINDTSFVLAGDTQEGYGDKWLQRAAVTQKGWGANSPKEASYPTYTVDADGTPLDASGNSYKITFAEGELPPVDFFWSVTMYDGNTQLMVDNPIDRYLINSPMLNDMVKGDDGSMVLYIQKDAPSDDLKPNWLPAPDGPFYMLMRLYGPQDEFLNGDWTPPAATVVK